ncbi:MAG: DinB family protein [Planctomycetaceae bacterium]|nr:DinB family protein [Planctomycetaceae bacterium]
MSAKPPSSADVEAVLRQLNAGPALIVSLVAELEPDIVKRRPRPGVWSAHEHACHLPDVQPLFRERLETMLSTPNPVIRSYDPARDDPDDALLMIDLQQAMDRFVVEREEMVEQLRHLTLEQWSIEAEHDEYSHYSVFIMYRHLALHDLYHAYRIEERLLMKDWPSGA